MSLFMFHKPEYIYEGQGGRFLNIFDIKLVGVEERIISGYLRFHS